jgi:uncharacterized protein YtpQ (UPF0354 family)
MQLTDTTPKTRDKIVPRIYVALPNVGTADVNLSLDDSPVETHLIEDILVFYAYDVGSHYEIVSRKDLTSLGMEKHELHELALQNLRALNLEVRAHKGDRAYMLTCGGNYEATLILLPEIWNSVHSMVEGRIIAVVPARDILYFTGDASHENLADLRRWTSKMIESAEKPLSRAFIRWDGESWSPYRGYAE